jgi:hypothetical protein
MCAQRQEVDENIQLRLHLSDWLKKEAVTETDDMLVLLIHAKRRDDAPLAHHIAVTSLTGSGFLPHVWTDMSTPHQLPVDSSYVALSADTAQGQYADQLKLSLHKPAPLQQLIAAGPRQLCTTPLPLPPAPHPAPQTGYAKLLLVLDATPPERRTWTIQLQIGTRHVYTYTSSRMRFNAVKKSAWGSETRTYGELAVPMTRVVPQAA